MYKFGTFVVLWLHFHLLMFLYGQPFNWVGWCVGIFAAFCLVLPEELLLSGGFLVPPLMYTIWAQHRGIHHSSKFDLLNSSWGLWLTSAGTMAVLAGTAIYCLVKFILNADPSVTGAAPKASSDPVNPPQNGGKGYRTSDGSWHPWMPDIDKSAGKGRNYFERAANIDIYGEPGAGLGQSGFSESNIENGLAGERKTYAYFKKMAQAQSGKSALFNGVYWPGSRKADVDHIYTVGSDRFVIDSKNYSAGTYTLKDDATIQHTSPDGEVFFRPNSMAAALEKFKSQPNNKHFYKKAYIVIHPSSDASKVFVKSVTKENIMIGTVEQVWADIAKGGIVAKEVPSFLVSDLKRQLK